MHVSVLHILSKVGIEIVIPDEIMKITPSHAIQLICESVRMLLKINAPIAATATKTAVHVP